MERTNTDTEGGTIKTPVDGVLYENPQKTTNSAGIPYCGNSSPLELRMLNSALL